MANRADQFDDVAIDYCVTHEVSPPSWGARRARCGIRRPRPTDVAAGAVVSEGSDGERR